MRRTRQANSTGNDRCGFRARWAIITLCVVCSSLSRGRGQVFAQVPCSYDVVVLPNYNCGLFSGAGNPVAINNLGHVLLNTPNCSANGADRALLWTGGTSLTVLPVPPGYLGFTGADMNDHGVIVGYAATNTGGFHGAIYDIPSGQWTIIPPLNGPQGWSGVNSINNSNEACGFSNPTDATGGQYPQTALRWSMASGVVVLGFVAGESTSAVDIADDGAVAVILGVGTRGYIWHKQELTALPAYSGAETTTAGSITTGLRMAGGAFILSGGTFWSVPLCFEQAEMTELPLPDAPNTNCVPIEINQSGLILGRCKTISPTDMTWRPYLWFENSVIPVNSLISPVFGLDLRWGSALNDAGQILCRAQTSQNMNVVVRLTPQTLVSGDVTCDGRVNHEDLLVVVSEWGAIYSIADVNHDQIVDVGDLLYVIARWTG